MTIDRFKEILAVFAHGTHLDTVRGWAKHDPEEAFLPFLVADGPVAPSVARKLARDFRTHHAAFQEFVRKRHATVLGMRQEDALRYYLVTWTGFYNLAGAPADLG